MTVYLTRLIRLPLYFAFLLFFGCSHNNSESPIQVPAWYISPKPNDSLYLYGVGEGYTIKESTNDALSNVSAKLMVEISSNSSLIREENSYSINEEMRQNIKQTTKKIIFTNYDVSNSAKVGQKFFVEVRVPKDSFVKERIENIAILRSKALNLDNNSINQIAILRKKSLEEIIEHLNEILASQKILEAVGENQDIKKTQADIASYEDKILKLNQKIEIVFDMGSPTNVTSIVGEALNNQNIKTSRGWVKDHKNQLLLRVRIDRDTKKIYGSYITKLKIDFSASSYNRTIASSSQEVTGSSVVSERDSFKAALKKFDQELKNSDILQVIGIDQL